MVTGLEREAAFEREKRRGRNLSVGSGEKEDSRLKAAGRRWKKEKRNISSLHFCNIYGLVRVLFRFLARALIFLGPAHGSPCE
jgi:hypothetical protein